MRRVGPDNARAVMALTLAISAFATGVSRRAGCRAFTVPRARPGRGRLGSLPSSREDTRR